MIRRLVRSVLSHFPLVWEGIRHVRALRRSQGEPPMTPLGFRFMGHPWMEAGRFEVEEAELVSQRFPTCQKVVNVGANAGYYLCLAAQAGIPAIGIEPIPANLQLLYRNLQVNGYHEGVEIYPVACAERAGLMEIFGSETGASLVPGWAGTPQAQRQTIPVHTLDGLLGDKLAGLRSLILIDVEGAELAVLGGARHLLHQQPRPEWLVEICVHENQPVQRPVNPHLLATFEVFWAAGYQAVTANRQRRPITREDVLAAIDAQHNTLGHYNFLFTAMD